MDEDAIVICKRFIDFQLLGKNWRLHCDCSSLMLLDFNYRMAVANWPLCMYGYAGSMKPVWDCVLIVTLL